MAETSYINLYEDAASYAADASARAALGGSTVSMEDDTKVLHYDGVNVEVPRSAVKVGTLVYADATGETHFIDGATAKAASISSGWEFVGVVALRRGNKATILYKEETDLKYTSCWAWEIQSVTFGESNTIQFQQRALTSEGASTYTNVNVGDPLTFTPTDIDDAVNTIDTFLRANQGGKSQSSLIVSNYNWHCAKLQDKIWVIADFDSTSSIRQYETVTSSGVAYGQIVSNKNPEVGPVSMSNMYSLAGLNTDMGVVTRNDGYNSNYFSLWNYSVVKKLNRSAGSPADEVAHNGYYSETDFNSTTVLKAYYGTYENYCKALMPKFPTKTGAVNTYFGRGKDICAAMEAVTYVPKDGGDAVHMFSAVHWAKSRKAHSTASVESLNTGDWYIPVVDEMYFIFSQMDFYGSDDIHKALVNAGLNNAYSLDDIKRYTSCRCFFAYPWMLNSTGAISTFDFSQSDRATAVALLEL